MPVFLLLVLTTAETAAVGHAVYAGRAILEDGPFVEIPTYCASLCLIFIWHSEVSQKVMSKSYPFIFFYLFFLHWPILLNFLNIFGLLTLRCEHRRKKKKKSKNLVQFYTKVQFVEGTCNSNFTKGKNLKLVKISFFISI